VGESDVVNSGVEIEREAPAAALTRLRVLQLEDDLADSELILRELRRDGFDVTCKVVQTPEEFREQVRVMAPDIVLADYNLGQWRGIEALKILRDEGLEIPLILVSGAVGETTAVECIKEGATDYVLKDHLPRLPSSVRRALAEKDLRERHKRSDAALREKQEQLEALIQSAMDAIVTVGEEQKIVVFNAAAERMFRCPAAQAVGQPIERFIPQRFRLAHAEHIRRFGETGDTTRSMDKPDTLMALRADGEEFPMEASISHIRAGDRMLFTVILRDITERRKSEKKLAEKMAELARSNDDLEQFAYVASHDLQEPLRMVAAYTQLLAERYRGRLDDNADKFIGYASEGALRMQVLIQDLLAFSRTGRRETSNVSVDCNSVLQEVLQTMASSIQESHAVITQQELPVIWADRTQITQVFQNLIGNAIKFRREVPPLISIRAEKADQHGLFSVSDNGIGVAPEDAGKIFEVFHRLHTRNEYPGNGIGLAICKKIIERGGGKIWVESQAGSGSTFRFTVPLQSPDAPEGTT